MRAVTRSLLLAMGVAMVAITLGSASGVVASAALPPDPVPVPALPPIEDPTAESARLVPVPTGCSAPPEEQAVFVGTLIVNDSNTARFKVDQVRAGSVEGFAVGGLIDVRYGDDTRFLEADVQYIVGAAVDPELGVLASRVRESAPLFGGNEIAGVDDSDVACPRFEDPVRTLLADNTPVESGVLSPMKGASSQMLRAVMEPIGVAFVILFALVLVKHLVFALGRSIRDLGAGSAEPRSD
ncbi:MAG: hypothetical protein RLZZ623_1640 [Actinomycetota bacterium]|jgi:hypothetical protein